MNHSGKIGEEMWANYLLDRGYDITPAPEKRFYDWDIKADKEGKTVTFEVKYDEKAYWWAKRRKTPNQPNLYIEFRNTSKSEDSGILASKADYYIYIMKEDNDTAYVFKRKELAELCQCSNFRVVGNSATGDDNAEGWIPKLSEVTSDKNVFVMAISLSER